MILGRKGGFKKVWVFVGFMIDISGVEVIEAKYDRIKDWERDLKGYFLIRIKDGFIEAGFCEKDNKILKIIKGRNAIEIVNTIIREGLVGSMQHAADLGVELCKAEIALENNLEYVQDGELEIKK
tara:strand:- start:8747 stop:9121 length:375 start_codon:yes stop_codon:yes gene_type:complete